MYKTVIVDDENKLREVLRIKLSKECPELNVCGEAQNAEDAFRLIKDARPHLVFLDIAMPGASGFDLLDRFELVDFEIIFVTGFNEFALDALKVSAVDYLLKPVKNDDLAAAVQKAIKRIKNKAKLSKYDILKHNVQNIGSQDSKISIPGTDSYEFVSISNIIRCEGWNKYTKIFLKNEAVIVSSYNIGIFKDMLLPYGFYSSHKSHVINKSYITKYLKEGTIILDFEHHVPLARRRRDEFLNEVMKDLVINGNS